MAKANMSLTRNVMPTQDAKVRAHNFDEVALGYTEEMAIEEAARCLECKHMPCVSGCPVNIHIPAFIAKIKEGEFEEAYQIIAKSSSLPAVCGRVCPQETQLYQNLQDNLTLSPFPQHKTNTRQVMHDKPSCMRMD